jgi:putative transposase
MAAAQSFFKQALEIAGNTPLKVTTDGHDSYPRAVKEVLGDFAILKWALPQF